MTYIRCVSTTTVRPTNDHKNEYTQSIELTPWDLKLLLLGHIHKGLLFHKPKSLVQEEPSSNSWIEHLKATLSQALDIFYPLAGRLALTENEDQTSSLFLHCNGEGVGFVHAVAYSTTVADILKPTIDHDLIYSFFPAKGVLNYQGISKPLLAVQVTELVDGIFIGCSLNHSVGDGTSFWHFFNTWSQISRGSDQILSQSPPDFSRQYLDGIMDLPIHIPSLHNQTPAAERFVSPVPLQQRVLHFSKEKIAQLKAKANSEMGTTKISSFQALLGHLWVCVTRSRNLNDDEEIRYWVGVGLRQRMQPRLPDNYIGNAICDVLVKSTAGDLLQKGPSWAAWEINKEIASYKSAQARKSLEDWAKNPVLFSIGPVVLASRLIQTSSSPRFNVYGNDFGWGNPIAVRSGPESKFDGKFTVFPGVEEGSIDFEACLLPETLLVMAEDPDFMDIFAA